MIYNIATIWSDINSYYSVEDLNKLLINYDPNIKASFKYNHFRHKYGLNIDLKSYIVDNPINDYNNRIVVLDEYVIIQYDGVIKNLDYIIETYNKFIKEKDYNENHITKLIKEIEGIYNITIYDPILNRVYLATNIYPIYYIKEQNRIILTNFRIKDFVDKLIDIHNVKNEILIDRIKNDKLYNSIQHIIEPYSIYRINSNFDIVKIDNLSTNLDTNKVLVVLSGGLDSTVLLAYYINKGYDVTAIHFNYGQKASAVEDFAVTKLTEYYNIPLIKYDIRSLFKNLSDKSKLLNANDNNIECNLDMPIYYVPNRNMIMLSIAMSIAESLNIGIVAFGANHIERNYPDNTSYFTDYIDNIAKVALNFNNALKIETPFVYMSKKDIVQLGKKLNVPFEYSNSCYYPKIDNNKIVECGKCTSCVLKQHAFSE